jgi:hypothetical protein
VWRNPRFANDLFKLLREYCSEENDSTIREYCLYPGVLIAVNSDYHRLYGYDDIMDVLHGRPVRRFASEI